MAIVEPEDGKSYGMAAVTNWVDGDDFPLTAEHLREHFGDEEVFLGFDARVSFGEILDRVEAEEFTEITDLWQALGSALKEIDSRRQRYES